MVVVKSRQTLLHHTTSEWAGEAGELVLLNGEVGVALQDGKVVGFKLGDGENTWSGLPYYLMVQGQGVDSIIQATVDAYDPEHPTELAHWQSVCLGEYSFCLGDRSEIGPGANESGAFGGRIHVFGENTFGAGYRVWNFANQAFVGGYIIGANAKESIVWGNQLGIGCTYNSTSKAWSKTSNDNDETSRYMALFGFDTLLGNRNKYGLIAGAHHRIGYYNECLNCLGWTNISGDYITDSTMIGYNNHIYGGTDSDHTIYGVYLLGNNNTNHREVSNTACSQVILLGRGLRPRNAGHIVLGDYNDLNEGLYYDSYHFIFSIGDGTSSLHGRHTCFEIYQNENDSSWNNTIFDFNGATITPGVIAGTTVLIPIKSVYGVGGLVSNLNNGYDYIVESIMSGTAPTGIRFWKLETVSSSDAYTYSGTNTTFYDDYKFGGIIGRNRGIAFKSLGETLYEFGQRLYCRKLGKDNTNLGTDTSVIMSGAHNSIGSGVKFAFVAGDTNACTKDYDTLIGWGLKNNPSDTGEFIIGGYNDNSTPYWFSIGTGSSNSNRRTSFAVSVDNNNKSFIKVGTQTINETQLGSLLGYLTSIPASIITGLGTAAFTASSDYVTNIAAGTAAGEIKFTKGSTDTSVIVPGLNPIYRHNISFVIYSGDSQTTSDAIYVNGYILNNNSTQLTYSDFFINGAPNLNLFNKLVLTSGAHGYGSGVRPPDPVQGVDIYLCLDYVGGVCDGICIGYRGVANVPDNATIMNTSNMKIFTDNVELIN